MTLTNSIDDKSWYRNRLRFRAACAAMTGLLAREPESWSPGNLAEVSFMYADALLTQFEGDTNESGNNNPS